MMKLKNCILIVAISFFPLAIVCMEQRNKIIPIQLDDNTEPYALKKWKIRESNTLYKHYLSQKNKYKKESTPIHVPHITMHEITLFDTALNYSPNTNRSKSFKGYYKNLSDIDKINLIIASGKWSIDGKSKKLNAKRLTTQLVMESLDEDIIATHIVPKIDDEFIYAIDFLITNLIKDNIKHQKITTSPPFDCANTVEVAMDSSGLLHVIPELPDIYFKGVSSSIQSNYQEKQYVVECLCSISTTKTYHLTSEEAQSLDSPETKTKILWIVDEEKNTISLGKIIQHKQPICCQSFSKNARYLATNSLSGQLMLTHLTSSDEHPLFSDTILNEKMPNILRYICFNNASTILAATSCSIYNGETYGTIFLWDTNTQQLLASLHTRETFPFKIMFSDNDNILISLSFNPTNNNAYNATLWKINDTNRPQPLTSIDLNQEDQYLPPTLTSMNNTTILTTPTKIIFIDQQTGIITKSISHTQADSTCYETIIPIFYINNNDLIFLGMKKNDQSTCIKIIDYINEKCIATIETKGINLNHIGLPPTLEKIVSTYDDYTATVTKLYSKEDSASIRKIITSSNILQRYLLWRIAHTKKTHQPLYLNQSLRNYIKQTILTDKNGKKLIKKYFLN